MLVLMFLLKCSQTKKVKYQPITRKCRKLGYVNKEGYSNVDKVPVKWMIAMWRSDKFRAAAGYTNR